MQPAGIALALVSALVWGSGDFFGGLASRRGNQFQVLAVAAVSGIALLAGLALIGGEGWPSAPSMLWAASGGLAGALGIAALYRGLAVGSAATVAPTAAVVTAALPVVFHAWAHGAPSRSQLAGFAVAAVGIWLVATGPRRVGAQGSGLRLAILAGLGFGGFLILIAQVPAASVFAPLAVARSVTLITAIVLMTARGVPIPSPTAHPLALIAGVLDAGGNVFYLLARQHTGLDVAAVLSSFYPVATVALARIVLGETVSLTQWVGAAACLAAVGLITI